MTEEHIIAGVTDLAKAIVTQALKDYANVTITGKDSFKNYGVVFKDDLEEFIRSEDFDLYSGGLNGEACIKFINKRYGGKNGLRRIY